MKRTITHQRSAPLDKVDTDAMLTEHLPYRIAMLLDGALRLPCASMQDNQAFEAGAVAGRQLLSFLGIGYNNAASLLKHEGHQKTGRKTDDVKCCDIGGRLQDIKSLADSDQQVLGKFIHGVHKASAHLTIHSEHRLDAETYKRAAIIILRLLQECLPPGPTLEIGLQMIPSKVGQASFPPTLATALSKSLR